MNLPTHKSKFKQWPLRALTLHELYEELIYENYHINSAAIKAMIIAEIGERILLRAHSQSQKP